MDEELWNYRILRRAKLDLRPSIHETAAYERIDELIDEHDLLCSENTIEVVSYYDERLCGSTFCPKRNFDLDNSEWYMLICVNVDKIKSEYEYVRVVEHELAHVETFNYLRSRHGEDHTLFRAIIKMLGAPLAYENI